MSQQPISRSPDLKRLRDDGFEVEISSGYLLIHGVPYVAARGDGREIIEVKTATLASELTLSGDVTTRPGTHVALWTGDQPCNRNGTEIIQIKHSISDAKLGEGLVAKHSFSNKPNGGYGDYYQKMTVYIDIISHPAQSIDPKVTARTFRVVESNEEESVYKYLDTASSRAEIGAMSEKLGGTRIGIVGLGGTGSYVLDLIAKTPVKEIHLYDGDKFLQHNAFRAPGASSIEKLRESPQKVNYFRDIYLQMRKNVIAHDGFLSPANIGLLDDLDFAFLCLEGGDAKKPIIERLEQRGIPFIDVGMGIEIVEESKQLIGIVRVTTCTNQKRDHVGNRISLGESYGQGIYGRNIQIADLNALNAALAVIKWKKLRGFYQDIASEHHSTFSINTNVLTNEEIVDGC